MPIAAMSAPVTTAPVASAAPMTSTAPVPSTAPVTASAPMATAAKMMTAAEAAVSAEVVAAAAVPTKVMTAAVVAASVSRFGNDRHRKCRHHRHHEYDYAFHCGSLNCFCRGKSRRRVPTRPVPAQRRSLAAVPPEPPPHELMANSPSELPFLATDQ